jgi:hypothetical protein
MQAMLQMKKTDIAGLQKALLADIAGGFTEPESYLADEG